MIHFGGGGGERLHRRSSLASPPPPKRTKDSSNAGYFVLLPPQLPRKISPQVKNVTGLLQKYSRSKMMKGVVALSQRFDVYSHHPAQVTTWTGVPSVPPPPLLPLWLSHSPLASHSGWESYWPLKITASPGAGLGWHSVACAGNMCSEF